MLGMNTRQATKWTISLLTLIAFITACSPSNQPVPTSTRPAPTNAPQSTSTPELPIDTSTPITSTPPACLTQPSRLEAGKLESTQPLQEYLIYLPPCYNEQTDKRYPVLYLLHGQTYTDDQWIRLGAVDTLNKLILSGESPPFIIVFPDDRYWNLIAGPGFGGRLVDHLVPYIDETYRTIPRRDQRAIGGMSRGAGWALKLGLTRWDLFSIIGLHSLAVFQGDGSQIEKWLKEIPGSYYPNIFMDIGDNDQEYEMAVRVEATLTKNGVPHEWHLYSGAHTEAYWGAHVEEYITWYASQWNNP
jgi:enterochelin esterase-like enzyme